MGLGFIGIGVGAGLVAACGTLWLGGGGLLAALAYTVGGTTGAGASVALWLAHEASGSFAAAPVLQARNT